MNIDEAVYGHAQAKKALRALVRRSQERYHKKCVMNESVFPEPLKCLLIGDSGTGKSHLVRSFKKLYDFPLLTIDATHLTPVGNSGGTNPKQLKQLIYELANEELKRPNFHSIEGVLNQMVIFVDEFDKLGNSWESSGSWNSHVQANFLTLIDDKEEFGGISWVFAGAFTHIAKKHTNNFHLGFHKKVETTNSIEITDQDIIKAGIIPEMLGRISLVLQLDVFSEDDYMNILQQRLLPLYPMLKETLEVSSLIEISKKAHLGALGVRGLNRQLELLSIDLEDEKGATR